MSGDLVVVVGMCCLLLASCIEMEFGEMEMEMY